ncbi:MAG: hypothetical protein ABW036_13520, partial [Flavitalea sp.]
MGKLLLRFARLFAPVFRKQGVDTGLLYAIVELKLLMDSRRVYVSWRQKNQKENNSQMTWTLLMYTIMGGFAGLLIVQLPIIPAMMIFHAFVIFMMAMTLITDFSSVLLDTADNQIILPRPVNGKTLFMARLIHILIYLVQFSISISVIPVIIGFIVKGPVVGSMMILTSQLAVLFSVSLTYILYLLVLRYSNEQKLKDIVSNFQIAMTIFFVAGYQVVPRLIDIVDLEATYHPAWYSWLLPPVWMAIAIEAVSAGIYDTQHSIMLILAVSFPILLFWAMNKYLAPNFAKQLDALGNTGQKNVRISDSVVKTTPGISTALGRLISRSAVERAAFSNTWRITGRDKSFRLQFYPSLAYIPVLLFIFVFNSGKNMGQVMQELPQSNKFIILMYLPMFTVNTAVSLLGFSENFQASWIYHAPPLARPGEIISGSLKAMLVKFFFPVYFFFLAVAIFVWGSSVINDFLMGLFNSLFCILAVANLSEHFLPFSRQPNVKQQSGKFLNIIVQFIVIGVLVGLHFF